MLEAFAVLRADPCQADVFVDRWLLRFAAVADRKLRRGVLQSCLAEIDDASLLGSVRRLEERGASGDARARWLLAELALTPSVLLDLPYDRLAELYVAAREAGEPALARRFLGDRAAPFAEPTANPHFEASAGERTAFARGTNRERLDRLAFDRDPRVIAALLDNPRATERDAIRIAALRPTSPDILRVVAAHPRWSQRHRVRKALAFNPWTPSGVARQLLPTLLKQDLAEIAGSKVISEEIRAAVEELLRAAPGGPLPQR